MYCFLLSCTAANSDCISAPEREPLSQTPILRYARFLKGVYQSAVMSLDKFPYLTCSKFINLALVNDIYTRMSSFSFYYNYMPRVSVAHSTLHGHKQRLSGEKKPINLEAVLNSTDHQQDMKCIVMVGPPGIGKSMCVWELCRKWDEIVALKKYSLVIFLRLREKKVQEAKSVEDLCYHRNSELRRAVAADIEASEGKGVLFILDGFDELPASLQKESIFTELVLGTYLSQCKVLVTGRPIAIAHLQMIAGPQIHKKVEVLGFTQENIEQYATTVFTSQPELLANFLTYISTNPIIKSLMYVPLYCAIVVEVYRHNSTSNRPIPQTMTQLYTELCLTLLKRHLNDDGPLVKQLVEKVRSLPRPLCHSFFRLAKLAFKGTVQDEVIFNDLGDDFEHFGFMNSHVELYMGEKACNYNSFLHLTLQQFLAAFHISQLSPRKQKIAFDQYCKHYYKRDAWDVVWGFVAGLTGFSDIGWEKVVSKRGKYDKYGYKKFVSPFIVRCLYEAQDKVDLDSVLGDHESEVSFKSFFVCSAFDCFAVGYCIGNSECAWRLSMRFSDTLGVMLFEMLQHGLYSPKKSPPHMEHANVLSIDISRCRLHCASFNRLADVIPVVSKLEQLNINGNPAGEGGIVKLLYALSKLKHFKTLSMTETAIGLADIEALAILISPPSSVKELSLGKNSLQYTELMFKTVLAPSSLEYVVFVGMTWTDQAAALLEENNNLISLAQYIDYGGWRELKVARLCKALHKNTNLKEFSIQGVFFSDNSFADIIRNNQALEVFKIATFKIPISEEQVTTINSALMSNRSLKRVLMYGLRRPADIELDPRIDSSVKRDSIELRFRTV